jgi:hypothetical protein
LYQGGFPSNASFTGADTPRFCFSFTIKMSTAEKLAMGKTDEPYGRQNL